MATRFNWGTGITLVYTAFALGTLGMVTLAMHLPDELVSEDYYGQSLTYDDRIAATERADALGPGLVVEFDATARALTIGVPADVAGGARGRVTLYRPSAPAADRVVPIAFDADGRARIRLDGLAPGLWRAQIAWESHGRAFYRERAITLP